MIKKIDNYFFYENINHYTKSMTGHGPNAPQNQEFLSTMHTMIDDLDTISPNFDEVIYVRLVNGLQRLYNIHNSELQASTSIREIWNNSQQENNIAQNISSALVRHYERVNDISGIHINAYPVNRNNVNTYVYHVNSDNANNQNNHSMHWIEAALREGITRT